MKTYGNGGITPPFLNSTLDGDVSFTFRPLYFWGNKNRYPLNMMLGSIKGRFWHFGEKKNHLPLQGTERRRSSP
jgi:hypothetical protein